MTIVDRSAWNSVMDALKENERNPVCRVSAESVLMPRRLDTVIRELALEELVCGHRGAGVEMYHRWLSLSHGICEATGTNVFTAYFSDYSEKSGFGQYCCAFLRLYESIREKGFDPKYFIPIDSKGNPMNGMHRLAAALYLGIDVYIKNYESVRTGWVWDCGRLAASDFSEGELFVIIKKYAELKKHCFAFFVPHSADRQPSQNDKRYLETIRQENDEVGCAVVSAETYSVARYTKGMRKTDVECRSYRMYLFQVNPERADRPVLEKYLCETLPYDSVYLSGNQILAI